MSVVPPIPMDVRAAVSEQLDRLVKGDLPDLLIWVRRYGQNGATLAVQPTTTFDHSRADAVMTDDGGWHVVVPLFTTEESPSDLSAEVLVDARGQARISRRSGALAPHITAVALGLARRARLRTQPNASTRRGHGGIRDL